jgi:hypothetical protein
MAIPLSAGSKARKSRSPFSSEPKKTIESIASNETFEAKLTVLDFDALYQRAIFGQLLASTSVSEEQEEVTEEPQTQIPEKPETLPPPTSADESLPSLPFPAEIRFVTPGAATTAPPWRSTLSESEGDWYLLPWFGAFLPFDNGWIYHTDLGWLYAQPDGVEGLWFWSEGQGWLWTNPDSFRYLYRASTSGWIYFLKLKDGRAYFYNYATGSVE